MIRACGNPFLTFFALFIFNLASGQNDVLITSDFPGGNIEILSMDQDTIRLKPNNSFTKGEWFYWYFKASNIAGKKVTFKLEQENVIARYGPGYSINNDHSWKWYGESRINDNSFTCFFSEEDSIAYFSTSFPYLQKDLRKFLSTLKNSKYLEVDTLCFSPEGRAIEKILIRPARADTEHKVMITARHHACEMMANYVMEGIIETILNDKNCSQLHEYVEFMFVPFMDKDGVENGEQGKNRIPRDHNRDYIGDPVHQSTAALRELAPEWGDQKLAIAVDLHCPWIHTSINETIYVVGSSDPEIEKSQIMFSKLLESNANGDLKLYHKDFIPFGTSWNTSSNYSAGMSFAKWASSLESVQLSCTIEFPYANVSGIPVSKDGAREFGKAIAYSISDYLQFLDQY